MQKKILTLIKQVPIPKMMRTTGEGFMDRSVASQMNPYCKHALEEALRVKDTLGGEVTVLSMGPPSFVQSLKEALAMGADHAYLLTDRRLAGSDTMATAKALSKAINHIGEFDIIFAGIQTIDGDTGHVGPQVAERLGMNQVTYVIEAEYHEDHVIAKRRIEMGYQKIKVKYPVLLTITKLANTPRGPALRHAIRAKEHAIKFLSIDDIGLPPEEAGIPGSPTVVARVKNVVFERPPCKFIENMSPEKEVEKMIELLEELASEKTE